MSNVETQDLWSDFNRFHTKNPLVYDQFKKYTFEVISSGRKNFSVAAIFERIRWESSITTEGEAFKIKNDFKPYYARFFMKEHPQFNGFFITKRCAADK